MPRAARRLLSGWRVGPRGRVPSRYTALSLRLGGQPPPRYFTLMSFQLVAISPAADAAELSSLPALFDAGLPLLHVRKPTWPRVAVADYLRAIPARYHARLVLHAHYELAFEYAVAGIHLTEHARQQAATPGLLRRLGGRSVSASFHSLAAVVGHRRRYNYVFLSPIFNSISKIGYASSHNLSQVQPALRALATRASYCPQVLALGGVEASTLPLVRQAGFAGAAVLGALWQQPDPLGAWQQLRAAAGA